MEEPCYKCGQMVEEGRVFCPQCRAPQIRVIVAAGPAEAVSATSPARQVQLTASETVPVIAVPILWNRAVKPCAVAAFIAALGMVSQLIYPVIAVLGAGFLSVALYRRQNPEIPVRPLTGARLGAICGFFCAGMTAILGALRVAILHEGGKIRAILLNSIQQQAGRSSDPEFQASLDFFRSPAGLMLMLGFLFILVMIILILLAMLGGALGGTGLGRRDPS